MNNNLRKLAWPIVLCIVLGTWAISGDRAGSTPITVPHQSDLEYRVIDLEATVGRLRRSVNDLESTVSDLESTVSDLEDRVEELE